MHQAQFIQKEESFIYPPLNQERLRGFLKLSNTLISQFSKTWSEPQLYFIDDFVLGVIWNNLGISF